MARGKLECLGLLMTVQGHVMDWRPWAAAGFFRAHAGQLGSVIATFAASAYVSYFIAGRWPGISPHNCGFPARVA